VYIKTQEVLSVEPHDEFATEGLNLAVSNFAINGRSNRKIILRACDGDPKNILREHTFQNANEFNKWLDGRTEKAEVTYSSDKSRFEDFDEDEYIDG
jgi:hypothetical protein